MCIDQEPLKPVADLVWFDVVRSNPPPPFFPSTHAHKNYSQTMVISHLGKGVIINPPSPSHYMITPLKNYSIKSSSRFYSVTSFFQRSSTVDSVILTQEDPRSVRMTQRKLGWKAVM